MLGLTVLKSGISNHEENFTRYLIVAKTPTKVDARIPSKVSIVMNTLNKPGALVDTLVVFKEHGINLTKLESRPIPGNSWEEMFYIDFLGNLEAPNVTAAIGEVTKLARFIKILGCFPACDITPTPVPEKEVESAVKGESSAQRVHIEVNEKSPPKSSGKDKGYKLASRDHKSSNTIINVGGVSIGDGNFLVIAGPCSVESRDQIMACAKEARDNGARILRGGVFKPRTSPYSFQGLGYEGLDLLVEAGKAFGMPVITEVMTTEDVERVAEKADILQIGARNMQNYSLLKAIGETRRPVMLKRGLSAPIEELLQATEYILAGGNQQVFLCERGIRTFETATRGTLDISAVPVLKAKTHLPVFIDPSHAAGVRELVPPLALAAKAVGADGIIVEFHPEPEKALSDGPQALRFPQFEKLMSDLRKIEV
jgi:chorismate mutase/prephenate dehydratase